MTMKRQCFIKKITASFVALALCLQADTLPVSAFSGEDFFAGASGLVRDAMKTVRSGSEKGSSDDTFNMEIEPTVERDLSGKILEGIYVDDINLSGKTYDEAVKTIKDKVRSMAGASITLNSIGDNSVIVTAGELGLNWNDTNLIADALYVGRDGNMVARYKQRKDLEHQKIIYPLKLELDKDKIISVVSEQGKLYNIEAKNASLSKADGDFHITPGTTGEKIDVNASVSRIESNFENFKGSDMTIDLVVSEDKPKATAEDLEKIHDIIGSFKTSFSTSSADRSGNVRNGTHLVDGTVLMPGEMFSMYNTVSPFTEENGYFLAGSYLNGMVVESLGGGICQVSSTLYNAVLRAELEVDERHNHSMIVSYVDLSSDAAISGTSKDFKFTNNKDFPIYIEGITTGDKQVIFNIYGVEERPENRKVSFESEKLSETVPEGDKIIADPGAPIGSIQTQSAHTGYTGKLWKIVTVDGKETERTEVNRSTYLPTQRTATVGTASDNPTAQAMIQSAIASGSIDNVKATIGELNAAAAAAAALGL